ncbi:TlpA family protein disulfide reductase [Neobacillus cucumis]|uniref:TlpA family protein disulfide reductase n=1 Tax=Neobacillus cucumis TaxID=1740721 RepID=UPI001963351C|nr:TlpA disulfide reductase family protein [Neobacillus cucumis]MBM7654141.1 thiol-disulfide isomerase/thioredoxin [Neobacillus cucumis]
MKLRDKMPELTGATEWVNGQVTKDELVGERPTLFHFWSISCHLCKEAMHQVNQLRDDYKEKLNVVAVHMPRSEADTNMQEIIKVAKEHEITQPIFVDGEHKLTEAFENQYVPAYYIFDREGNLRHYQAGGNVMKMLEKRVIRLVDEMEKAKECELS